VAGRICALRASLAIAGGLIGWYNYSRFDNPLEFGIPISWRGTQLDERQRTYGVQGAVHVASVYYLLALPAQLPASVPLFD